MKLDEWVFVGVVWGIPFLLVLRAWIRYIALGDVRSKELLRVRVALALLSISLSDWLFVYVLMSVDENSRVSKAILNPLLNLKPALSLAVPVFIGLPLSIGSLVFSRVRRNAVQEMVPLKKAVGLASGWLILMWLLFASNPH